MYRSLGAVAAALMLAAVVVPGPAAAAEQRQDPGIHKQVGAEEFSAQRRHYVGRRGYVGRRRIGARLRYRGGFYGPRFYRPYYRPYPYYAYGGYPYTRLLGRRPFFRFGPFGFGFGRWCTRRRRNAIVKRPAEWRAFLRRVAATLIRDSQCHSRTSTKWPAIAAAAAIAGDTRWVRPL